jgi:hypothetical protein
MRRLVTLSILLVLAATACDPSTVTVFEQDPRTAGPKITRAAVGPSGSYPLSKSWRRGCPVGPGDLVAIEFDHRTLEGGVARGVFIVNRDVASDVEELVRIMWRSRFAITSARPIDDFDGDDNASMAADNSSAFNCRTVAGTTSWSEHAYGRAIDVNPIRNPYVRGSAVEPPAGTDWLDRSDKRPGMLVEDHAIIDAIDDLGWNWGGRWQRTKDYQHISAIAQTSLGS